MASTLSPFIASASRSVQILQRSPHVCSSLPTQTRVTLCRSAHTHAFYDSITEKLVNERIFLGRNCCKYILWITILVSGDIAQLCQINFVGSLSTTNELTSRIIKFIANISKTIPKNQINTPAGRSKKSIFFINVMNCACSPIPNLGESVL